MAQAIRNIHFQSVVGKWVAWSHDGRRIVASGLTLAEAKSAAFLAGEKDPVFEKVPRADAWFVGMVV